MSIVASICDDFVPPKVTQWKTLCRHLRRRGGEQNLSTFSQERTGKHHVLSEVCIFMNAEFLWRLDDLPSKGTFVWVTHNNQPDFARNHRTTSGVRKSNIWYEPGARPFGHVKVGRKKS